MCSEYLMVIILLGQTCFLYLLDFGCSKSLFYLQATGSSSSTSTSGAPSSVQIPNLDESLQLMREMGIPDEDLSRQALQATNGDVQAAVNLIFAQWMADD